MALNYQPQPSAQGISGLSSFSRPYTMNENGHAGSAYHTSLSQQPPKYGTVAMESPVKAPRMHAKGDDLRNMLTSWLVPWALYGVVMSILSFTMHYNSPGFTRLVLTVVAIFVLLVFIKAVGALKSEDKRGAAWSMVLALSLLGAYVAGTLAGEDNYATYTRNFYIALDLNTYYDVDPSTSVAGSFMDGARVTFSEGSKVDVERAIGFMNKDIYCVAPIIKGANQTAGTFDFWAVGKNCCPGRAADFGTCADHDDPAVHSGLMVMDENLKPFYRLAVQQAEATWGITAAHPVFYKWLADPDSQLRFYEEKGYQYVFKGLLIFLGCQGLFALIAGALICAIRPTMVPMASAS